MLTTKILYLVLIAYQALLVQQVYLQTDNYLKRLQHFSTIPTTIILLGSHMWTVQIKQNRLMNVILCLTLTFINPFRLI